MRAFLLICALFLVATVTGCGSSAPAGPSTHVAIGIIEADLPGTGWEKTYTATKGPLVTETWKNKDSSLIYRVTSNPDEVLDGVGVQSSGVDEYMSLMNYPPSSIARGDMFHGRSGARMEAVRPEPEDYHMVEYATVAGFRQYYIGAGARNSSWNQGGEDNVNAILDSIQIKH